jgi:hypothetical protein
MTELAPVYHRYAAASAREIPVVVLERDGLRLGRNPLG